MTRSIPTRTTLLIAVAVFALSQSPILARADDGCSDLYAALRSATGDRLVEVVRRGDLRCLGLLRRDLDPPLQIAISRESNLITVANSIPGAMADYTGSGNDGVHQLFLYLRAAEYIHYYCLLDRSCNGEEWNSVETYSMEAGSPVHRAVKAAIDSFVEHPLFRHAGRQHTDTLHDVGYTIIFYEMSGLYLSLVEDWLNDWDDNYAANPIFHDQMREMLDIVSWGHVRPPFGDFFGEYRGLVHAFRDFVFAERWLGTPSQWIMERSAMELGRYFWHKDTTNYDYVLPIVLSALTTYRNRSEAKEIYLRLVGEIYSNDGDNCKRYDLCDWWAGEGFNANFRAAVFTDTMECPLNACSGETITMHAQDLEADKLATACQRMYEEGQAFQALFGTQCTPVPGDVNNHVDVYVFNDGDDCWQLQWPSFYSSYTCNGIHFEYDPSDPDTPVRLVVTEFTPNEEAPDRELPIVNFEHEYAHHLDARFNLHGPYLLDYDSAHWWIEGFAEYLSSEVSPYIGLPPCETPYSLTETLLHSLSIPTTYPQRHLAVRFLMENHRAFIDRLLEYTRRGEYAAYTAHLAAEAPKLEEEWQAWLTACPIGSDSRVRPYCYSVPTANDWGYITRVVLSSLDHAGDDSRGHWFYDETASVQAGATVELRVTASHRLTVEGESYYVEAWIDWDGDGRFDGRTEQVMYGEVQLTNPDHPVTVSENVRVPADAHIGTVRLRVRVQRVLDIGYQGVCENYESGETQDYNITVTADPNPGDGNGGGEDSRVDPYCHTVPEYYQFGYLSRVALGSLNHAGDDNLGHRFYDETVSVQAGSTVNLSVTARQQVPVEGDVNRVEAWIDWDGDGQFYGKTEQVMYREVELTNLDHPVTVSESVRVPADAHVGTVRLRVRVQYKTSSGQGVCENYESGETQDYDITVTADPNAGGGNGGGEDSRVDPYCHTVPEYYQFGYLSRVVLGSLDHASDDNLGHRFYDDTVTVQAGSTVELRVTASVRDPVEGDVNRVEAWIDWDGDGHFNGRTEQVMYREVELTNPDHPVTVSESVRVPAGAHVGTVRLRVRVQYKTSSGHGVCENYESGETQDYNITVKADPNAGGGNGGGEDSRVDPYCHTVPEYYQFGYLSRVALGSLNHAGDDNLGHRFYDETVSVQAGSTVDLSVTASQQVPVEGDVNRVEAWIDWDGDGQFYGKTEQVMYREVELTNLDHPVTVSESVRVPADAHVGTVRLRVRVQYKTSSGHGVCENYESGETQDYNITVTADPNDDRGGYDVVFVPVLLTSAGHNNAFFTSELTLTNRGDREAVLGLTYMAHRGGGSGSANDRVAPGQQTIHPNAIDYLTGLGIPIPSSGNRLGTLRVEVSGSSDVGVSVRTTTRVPEGRAGLAYPGISQDEGFQEAVYLCGLRQNAQDRSNLAFQHMGTEGEITLRTTVFSGDAGDRSGRMLGDRTLKPGQFYQYNEVLKTLGRSAQGYAKVERVAGNSPFYAYGVINDNFNSDGSFVFPITESTLVRTTGQTLPVIIETGSFQSELAVTNFSTSEKQVDFSFVADAVETSEDTATFSLTLKAGEQRIVPQIVSWLRRQGVAGIGPVGSAFIGALFATPADGDMGGIVIGARTGSPDVRGGQYSLFYNGVAYGAASTQSAWIYGLQQNEENRSNLALVNTGEINDSSSTFEITIYDGTGESQPRTKRVTLGPRRWKQENGILGNISQGYVKVRKTSGNNPFVAYGVINDGGRPGEHSGDGAFLLSQE